MQHLAPPGHKRLPLPETAAQMTSHLMNFSLVATVRIPLPKSTEIASGMSCNEEAGIVSTQYESGKQTAAIIKEPVPFFLALILD